MVLPVTGYRFHHGPGNWSSVGCAKSLDVKDTGLGPEVPRPGPQFSQGSANTMADFKEGIEAGRVKFLEEFELMRNTGGRVLIVELKTVDVQLANHSFIVALTKDRANTLGQALIKGSKRI